MMATSAKPASSSALRICSIWPSIMPDGLTMCAPARAWATAMSQ